MNPEPALLQRLRIAAERSAAVNVLPPAPDDCPPIDDFKRAVCGKFTFGEAEEVVAWIDELIERARRKE